MSKKILFRIISLLLLSAIISAQAQTLPTELKNSVCTKTEFLDTAGCNTILNAFWEATKTDSLDAAKDNLKQSLGNPDVLNKIVENFIKSKDLTLEFKTFKADGKDASLGLSYEYSKDISDIPLFDSCKPEIECANDQWISGLNLNFKAAGNVAFKNEDNPNDFLETKLSLFAYGAYGGPQRVPLEDQINLNEIIDALVVSEDPSTDTRFIKGKQILNPYLDDYYYFQIGLDAAYETDQAFEATQFVGSIRAGLDIKSWKRNSIISRLNIPDYPFALIRMLSGYDKCENSAIKCFSPRGSTFPTAAIALGRVEPDSDGPRGKIGDESSYYRFNSEISFRTPMARIMGKTAYFGANYRYYKELAPSTVVETAGLDDYSMLVLSVTSETGIFVTYSTGELPLDVKRDKTIELGFQKHF